jgi:hypothetical protein
MATLQEDLKKKRLAADRVATDRLNQAVRNTVSSLGIDPDVANQPVSTTLRNTIQNIKDKGILGSFYEGAKRSVNELATQSTNFGREYIAGGKSILIGSGDEAQRNRAADGTSSTNGSTPIDNTGTGANTPSIPTVPVSATSGGTRIGQTPQGQLSIADQAGGTGTIQFNDQRKLGQDSLDRLAGTINKNADPAFQQRLAGEAALSQSRYDVLNAQKEKEASNRELDFFKRSHLDALRRNDLVGVSQFANRIKEIEGANLNKEAVQTKSDLERNQLGFDVRKTQTQQTLEAAKQRDKLTTDFFKMISDSEKTGNSDPLTNYSAARSAFGDNIDRRVLHAALGSDVASSLLENRGNFEEQIPILQKLGFPEADAQYILNQINQ